MVKRREVVLQWRDRWREVDRRTRDAVIGAVLRADESVESPFGRVDGLSDLRGLQLPADQIHPLGWNKPGAPRHDRPYGAWAGMDLSGADLLNLRCWGVHVSNCTFLGASLNQAQLGPGARFWPHRSTWQGVSLRRADLRHVTTDAAFEQVDFRNARFGSNDFTHSDLVDCSFAGGVHGLELGERTGPARGRHPAALEG
jgi:hypothetical protein